MECKSTRIMFLHKIIFKKKLAETTPPILYQKPLKYLLSNQTLHRHLKLLYVHSALFLVICFLKDSIAKSVASSKVLHCAFAKRIPPGTMSLTSLILFASSSTFSNFK